MKTRRCSLLAMLVIGVGFLAMSLQHSPHSRIGQADETGQAGEGSKAEVYPHSPLTTAPVGHRAAAVSVAAEKTDMSATDIASKPAALMRVRADRPLAKVNNQAVLLKDLVPLREGEQEQTMTGEEYQSRLERAIEMELTFQAAALQRVNLTSEQKRRVNGIVQKHEAALRDYQKQGITWSSVTPSQVEFEQRLTSALLLQQNLVAMEARVAPSSDPGVQARYEQARSELLGRLKVGGIISVSIADL